jgi:uncharacterized protein
MHTRAQHLIRTLRLEPHPEGGHFREIHRSRSRVQPLDDRSERSSLTTIFFLLGAGEVSRWHRVASDEVWHHLEGAALELLTIDPELRRLGSDPVGPLDEGVLPVQTVPADWWQAARSTGDYTLVGCTVGPGFDFADFRLIDQVPEAGELIRQRFPEAEPFL